jgi:pilus assembly protein CpaF
MIQVLTRTHVRGPAALASTRATLDFLSACVRVRANIVISGGTGTGKTTMLNLLSAFIPNAERIVTIEDPAELQIKNEDWVSLETRPPNIESKGQVMQRDLVKNALRMRPDRIIVGECSAARRLRSPGDEHRHDGSLTTVHANSPRDALSRIENMVLWRTLPPRGFANRSPRSTAG